MSKARLVVDDSHARNWRYRLTWYLPDDGDMGASVGDHVYKDGDLKTLGPEDVDCAIAYFAAKKTDGVERDHNGFFWESKAMASNALRVVKAAIAAGVERPMPEWAATAIAAGFKPPKGWKP